MGLLALITDIMELTGFTERDKNELQEIVCAYLGIGMKTDEIVREIEEMYGISPKEGVEFVRFCEHA